MAARRLFLGFCLLFLSPHLSVMATAHRSLRRYHRRLLHQPFFPWSSLPPAEAPFASAPQSQPQQQQHPKLPFSSISGYSTPPEPFFPSYASSPPPPPVALSTALPTFPANISALLFPQPSAKPHGHTFAIAISVSLAASVFIFLLGGFLYFRRNRRSSDTDNLRLYPPDIDTSDGVNKNRSPTTTTSKFLYLGTVADSREIDEETSVNPVGEGVGSPAMKIGSPELKPLPPLPRHNFVKDYGRPEEDLDKHYGEENEEDDEDEEFFSPRGSTGGKESLNHHNLISRNLFKGMETDTFGRKSFNSSSISLPNSPSPPLILSPTSLQSKSPDSIIRFPAPLRPLPSQPVPSSSPSLSSSSSPQRNSAITQNPPPPPPPPEIPPSSTLTKDPNLGPPVLAGPSRPITLQNTAHIPPEEQSHGHGVAETKEENPNPNRNPKPKLKPLHWDKVRTSSDRAMVWDQMKSSSFQLNEEMIESLFMANNSNLGGKEKKGLGNQENRVLDPKKSQNIAILLRALNVTIEEVSEALLEGNSDTLGSELLESLLKMAPTKEEERNLREYRDESPYKLGAAEKFLKVVLDVPFAFKRIDAMLYVANFDSEIEYLQRSFLTLQAACTELKNSRMFLKLLEAVLKTGNRMNVGTNRGDAHAFKLDTLLKLVDIKAADGKTTLLHFVVQEIIRAEGYHHSTTNPDKIHLHSSLTNDIEFRKLGLQVVSGLSRELSSVKKAAVMDADVLSSEVAKLAGGITKVTEVLKLNEVEEMVSNGSGSNFAGSMNMFLEKAVDEIERVKARGGDILAMVREITEYFHGNSAKEEARPLRIFMVVRDFLAILDRVCKEVGRINERTIVGSAQQFTAAPNPCLVRSGFPGVCESQQYGSSDDDSSSSSA